MATENLNGFIRRLTRGMAAETLSDQSDRELVKRLLSARDDAAFEAIVRRHGPMVYRVCWRVLQHVQSVEDAFQATFLVLAQKLPTVRKHDSLASWLHGIAHRLALKAKAQAANRSRHEVRAARSKSVPADELTWRELRVVLDAEMAKLPEKWRLPLILCYLEARTQDEAARQLGWSKNTLRRRLEEAREALGRRLARSGVGPAAMSAVLLCDCASQAALRPSLVASTIEAAGCVVEGQAVSAVAPVGVVALVEGVKTTMALTRVKLALVLLLAGGVIAAGFSTSQTPSDPPNVRVEKGTPTLPKEPGQEGQKNRTTDALAGHWRMSLPAGFQYQVVIRPIDEKRLSVEKAVRFSGIYELGEGRLVLVEPRNPTNRGFEWEFRGADDLALVAQPPIRNTGTNYLGARLERLPAKDKMPDGGPAPTAASGRNGPMRMEGGKVLENGLEFEADIRRVEETLGPQALGTGVSKEEAAAAQELERIRVDYRLKKEPAYRAPVQYCLLLLGTKAPSRLWLASDGVNLYVDRNGNGDLTERGEAIPFKAEGFAAFFANPYPGGSSGVQHAHLHIAVRQRDWQSNKGGYWAVRSHVEGRYPMYAFSHKFAKKPEDAPVIHLGGPLRMGLYELERGKLRRGMKAELNAYVTCHYPGVEQAFVDVDQWARTDIHPVAEIRTPAREPKAAPILVRVPLKQRC